MIIFRCIAIIVIVVTYSFTTAMLDAGVGFEQFSLTSP